MKVKNNKFNSKITVVLIISVLIITIGVLLFINSVSNDDNTLQIDSNVIVGEMDTTTLAEKVKQAQEKVDEGMLALNIAPNPIFVDGESKGKVMIGNPSNNTKSFTVEFILSDNNQSVYKSGLIPPNGYIEEVALDKNLDKGEYLAVAYFTSYSSEGVEDGTVGINIKITILN